VDNNTIAGSIPSGFGKMSTLNFLDLDTNSLYGEIPEALYNLTSLIALDLDSNYLTGTISSRIGLLTNLFIVQLDNNHLNGTIPTETGLLKNLGTCVYHYICCSCESSLHVTHANAHFQVTLQPLATSLRATFHMVFADSHPKH
jgi:hypothetical protein